MWILKNGTFLKYKLQINNFRYFDKELRESAVLSMVKLDAGPPVQLYGDVLVIPMKRIRGIRLCDFMQQNMIQGKLSLHDIIHLQDEVIEKGFGSIHKQNIVQ